MDSSKTSPKKKFFKKRKKAKIKKVGRTVKVENSILETLGYRSIFDYPMSFYQLSNFLITKKKVAPEVLKDALNHLVRTRKLGVKSGKYYLYRTKSVPWKQRYNNSVSLLKKTEKVSDILSKIPWIKLIGVTGSVAAFNSTKNDDIDLFIVTKRKRLWLTRGFVFVILKILGQLRTDEKSNKKFCPNIFVDEDNLAWKKGGRNIYVAHEVLMLHPLFDRDNTYLKFLQKNDWAFKYFGNLYNHEGTIKSSKKTKGNTLNIVESWAYQSQLLYMRDRKTKEVTEKNIIHFNKVDNTDNILGGFQRIRKKIGLKTK